MTRPGKVAAMAAATVLFTAAHQARADVLPPDLDACAVRPLGSPCFVDGETRGVCVAQLRQRHPKFKAHREVVCRVAAPGVDAGAPPPPSSDAPAPSALAPVSAPASGAPAPSAPAPVSTPAPRASSCAVGQGGYGNARGLAVLLPGAALVLAWLSRRRDRPADDGAWRAGPPRAGDTTKPGVADRREP